jgi:hypothetical protein
MYFNKKKVMVMRALNLDHLKILENPEPIQTLNTGTNQAGEGTSIDMEAVERIQQPIKENGER